LTGLGLDVVGVRRTPTPEPGVERVYTPAELDEAVADARFVVLAVPLTDDTRGLVDRGVFEAMREDAIAGAALDVFEAEPLPESSPLWGMDDVIVSPHCAAYTRDYYRHVATILRESLDRVTAGDDPVNRVL
jgi:D-2-hydroxyacid dehydrogenase (NADP+)